MTTMTTTTTTTAAKAPPSRYLVSPGYDMLFFIGAPPLALLLAEVLGRAPSLFVEHEVAYTKGTVIALFIAFWTNAHLAAVFFRSHANPAIFQQHKVRFVVVPIVLMAAFLISDWALVIGIVVGVWWDVYHSSMQTFGFCRIYDARAGNPPELGRKLDLWANHVIYIGPILAGLSLFNTLDITTEFSRVGWDTPTEVVHRIMELQDWLRLVCVVGGGGFLAVYVISYARMARTGIYQVSLQKIAILVSTGLTSIIVWGFFPPNKAFFIANFFHGLQYFAIVWALEKKTITKLWRLDGRAGGRLIALVLFLVVIFASGVLRKLFGTWSGVHWMLCAGVVCSLLHFWYDGFVWSVRKRDVA